MGVEGQRLEVTDNDSPPQLDPPVQLQIDERRKLVKATVPWHVIARISDEAAGAWIKQLLDLRRHWERRGYTFDY